MVRRKTTLVIISIDLNLKWPTITQVKFVMVGHAEIVMVVQANFVMMETIKSYYNALHFIALH